MTLKLGILGSTRGSNLDPIISAISSGELDAKIRVIISNKNDAPILERARHYKIAHHAINPNGKHREQFDREVHNMLMEYRIDMVLLIGYMRIVSSWFCEKWSDLILNIHPSLLPKHAGLMDLSVHQSVLEAKEKESGCTIHYVTSQVDAGTVIIQKRCPVYPEDTDTTLKARVQNLEGEAWIEALKKCINITKINCKK